MNPISQRTTLRPLLRPSVSQQIDLKQAIFGVFAEHQWKYDRLAGNFSALTKSVCLCHCKRFRLIYFLHEIADTKHMTHMCTLTAHAFRSKHCKSANIYSQLACFSFCRTHSTWVFHLCTTQYNMCTQYSMCTHNWKENTNTRVKIIWKECIHFFHSHVCQSHRRRRT